MKTEQENVKPIVLENIVLYGMDGRPAVTYKRLELDGEVVRENNRYDLLSSQDECNRYFAACGDGRKLPTLPEMYAIIERLHETKHPALRGIDITCGNWFCTGTKIDYSMDKIIHPGIETINCSIPLGNHHLDEMIKNKPGEKALQALLGCRDVEKAVNVLHELRNKRPFLSTPSAESRRSTPERAVWINADVGRVGLYCYGPVVGGGRFRGVRVEGVA